MKRSCVALVALCVCLLGLTCSKETASPPAAAAGTSTATPSSSGGRVVGTVPKPPAGVTVIVVLDPKAPREFPPQTEKPAMDQAQATFGPSLLFVRTGQPTEFRNSDDTLHNVHVTHVETREPQFNVAIPTGEKYEYTFKRDGFYHVGCDIHPAMSAEVFASSSPYVAVADGDGGFALDDVPPGPYIVTAYEGVRRAQKDVDVTTGETRIRIE
jgi:plastocyanin